MLLRTRVLSVTGAVAGTATAVALRRAVVRSRTWGLEAGEAGLPLPGDDCCPAPTLVVTRAVTIDAPPEHVWPWITQIGQDRAGFYSYTWLENLVGCRMPEVHHLRAEWSTRTVGERIWMAPPDRGGGRACNVVARVDPGRFLVAVGPDDRERMAGGAPARWVWQFAVLPGPVLGTTRLVVRSRYGVRVPGLEVVHFVMERRMLRTIRALAEQHWRQVRDDPFPRAVPAPVGRCTRAGTEPADLSPARAGGPAAARR